MRIAAFCLFILLNAAVYADPPSTPRERLKAASIRQIVQALPNIHGWCWEQKAVYLMNLVFQEEPRVCVEIGVFGGSSALPIAYALKINKKGTLYAVDPWEVAECLKFQTIDDPNYRWWSKLDLEDVYRSFLGVVSRFYLKDYVQVLRKSSEDAALLIPDEIDLLHIDGNHSEEASMFDVLTYLPKVKVGGYILFDDAFHFQNTKAANYLIDNCEFIGYVEHSAPEEDCLIVRKIGKPTSGQ